MCLLFQLRWVNFVQKFFMIGQSPTLSSTMSVSILFVFIQNTHELFNNLNYFEMIWVFNFKYCTEIADKHFKSPNFCLTSKSNQNVWLEQSLCFVPFLSWGSFGFCLKQISLLSSLYHSMHQQLLLLLLYSLNQNVCTI